jgi:hypothetical protein
MPPRPDKITLRPNPVTGPLLVSCLLLDRAHPGYLRYVTTASTLKRQVNFVALMVLEQNGPDYLASHFRAAGLFEDANTSDCLAQIAHVLIIARAQDICGCDVLFGTASSTALRVLHRIGNEPLSRIGYRTLIDLMCNSEYQERGRIFSQECPVSESTLQAALRLPISLVRPEVMTRLNSVEQIDQLSAAFNLIFPLLPEGIHQEVWQSLETLRPTTSLRKWLQRMVEKINAYPISGPLSDDAETTFLNSPRAMADTGRRLQNCLGTLISQPLLSRYVYYLWSKPEAVIELRCLSRGFFVLEGVHTTGHGAVDAGTLIRIRQKFESTGRVLVGAEYAEARKANKGAKLLDVWRGGLPNLDEEDVIALMDFEEAD